MFIWKDINVQSADIFIILKRVIFHRELNREFLSAIFLLIISVRYAGQARMSFLSMTESGSGLFY